MEYTDKNWSEWRRARIEPPRGGEIEYRVAEGRAGKDFQFCVAGEVLATLFDREGGASFEELMHKAWEQEADESDMKMKETAVALHRDKDPDEILPDPDEFEEWKAENEN